MKVTPEKVSEFSRSAASKLRNMFAPMDMMQYSLDLIFTNLAHFPPWYDSTLKTCIFEKKEGPFKMEEIMRIG